MYVLCCLLSVILNGMLELFVNASRYVVDWCCRDKVTGRGIMTWQSAEVGGSVWQGMCSCCLDLCCLGR